MEIKVPTTTFDCQNLIGGEWVTPKAEVRDLISPYTGKKIGTVPMSSAADVRAAAQAATPAAEAWRQVPIKERTQLLFKFRDLVLQNLEELSQMEALEAGKTVAEARAGVLKGIEVCEYALSLQNLDDGAVLEVSRGVSCEIRREPMGVVAGITPFNFPSMVPMWLFPIAITVGNAFILKPSEKVPITACMIGKIMIQAGYPAGVFSIVHGGRETVEAVCDDPGIKVVGFVGSTTVAKLVYARAAANAKRSLTLGGAKNHLILLPDADPEVAVPGIVDSFIGCAGQRCMAASLLVAVGDCDHLLEAITKRAAGLKLGTDMGAVIDHASVDRLHGALAKAVEQGATLRLDGRQAKAPTGFEGGSWLGPTIIDNAKPTFHCATEELFGPVITIVRVATLDEALALEKANRYGNATSVFTTRGATARYVMERATSGMCGVNIGVPVPREPFSFGGAKESRFGQGDITGKGGVELWTWGKKITTKWAMQPDATWMS